MVTATIVETLADDVTTDSTGRKLTVREPGILQESRLARLMGDSSTNIGYMMGYVTPACMVVEIDGVAQQFPVTEAEVEATIHRVGRHGITAVMQHLSGLVKKQKDSADAIKKSATMSGSDEPAG